MFKLCNGIEGNDYDIEELFKYNDLQISFDYANLKLQSFIKNLLGS